MKIVIMLTSLLISAGLFGAEYMPYPTAIISAEEWQVYFQEVKENFSNSEQKHPEYNLVTYSDDQTRMSFAFTTEGHPAHPSWITRQVVESEGTIDMQQIGFFAGEEEAFAALFRQYAQLTEQTRRQFRSNVE